jgi:hypothetical protein
MGGPDDTDQIWAAGLQFGRGIDAAGGRTDVEGDLGVEFLGASGRSRQLTGRSV